MSTKSFNQYVAEKEESLADMKVLAKDIESLLNRKFPNANIRVKADRALTESISIWVGLIGNTRELSSGISGNDPLGASFIIFRDTKGFVAESSRSNLSVNPEEGSYMVMEGIKIPFRKVRGDEKKILSAFDRWATRAIDIIKKNEQNIYQRDKYSDKYFKF